MPFYFFFFNPTTTTDIYTLSLHDALPICPHQCRGARAAGGTRAGDARRLHARAGDRAFGGAERDHRLVRSEEHTSELQSHHDLVCRLLLEKKKKKKKHQKINNSLPISLDP